MEHALLPSRQPPLPGIGPWAIHDGGHRFRVWAPLARKLVLELVAPRAEFLAMEPLDQGYWQADVPGLTAGALYRFHLGGELVRPDPASHSQPHGVHGPSALVDHAAHVWHDQGFLPPRLTELILYEIHLGTFTPEGACQAAAKRLADLADLGVTAVQVMPVGQFPGSRNWGYDGVYPFSVHHAYGGPEGFKHFVEACHAHGLAVILDVVYNHLGPEGNYLRNFGPYFTDRYKTPWGEAVNFDGPESDHVRHYFYQNILHWLTRYHVDGFRLDATHAIHDQRPRPFLRELADLVRAYGTTHGRTPLLLAENDQNDPRLATPIKAGGLGLSGLYNEDFHHSVHARLTGERQGYYMDYGSMAHLAGTFERGFAYTGQYSAYRRRGHGEDPSALSAASLVAFLQNHDQTGNRAYGERLASLLPFEALKVAAGLLLLAPFTPLLFMGEEYGEDRPFLYCISHDDPGLIQAVRDGRLAEFADARQGGLLAPDPQAETTFHRSKLDWDKRNLGHHGQLLAWYRELIRLRKQMAPGVAENNRAKVLRADESGLLVLEGRLGPNALLSLFNLSDTEQPLAGDAPAGLWEGLLAEPPQAGNAPSGAAIGGGSWQKILDSAEARWGGPGPSMPRALARQATLRAWSLAVYVRQEVQA